MGLGVEESSLEFGPEDGCRRVVPVLPFGVVGVVRELSFGLSKTNIVVSISVYKEVPNSNEINGRSKRTGAKSS